MDKSEKYMLYAVIITTGKMVVNQQSDELIMGACICLLMSIYSSFKE